MNQLTEHLNHLAELYDKQVRGVSMYRFILDNGYDFKPAALPSDIERMKKKECFMNATHLMLVDSSLIYCEGFALNIIPVHHGWCVTQDGEIVDPTWDNPENCTYFGVPFQYDFVMESLDKSQAYGILDNHYLRWNMSDPKEKFLHEIWLEALTKKKQNK